ncbi:hypothetical protein I5P84_00550 [Pseudomonas mosselii]|uniref:hypothetical protein n=1 Tax=Pseudomonas mosselii TaxID=78327 RepID=UPI0018D63480|nr:hypothetical protein [Pseudomonas mosselii]MBH3307942.1 hypothetical protein [Pseudomonas mosselii]MBH3326568.1 hypothetical protein [Pseudomonas mosselii]
MLYKGFRIENNPAYIWRIYCWGAHSGHNHVACWYVLDAEGKRLAGGYDAGNNTRSGRANIPRRKDAKAWIDGWHAFLGEPQHRKCAGHGFVYGASYGAPGVDSEMRANFDEGYWEAQRRHPVPPGALGGEAAA